MTLCASFARARWCWRIASANLTEYLVDRLGVTDVGALTVFTYHPTCHALRGMSGLTANLAPCSPT
ncbi:MAG: hypothetical protein U0V48_16975 [Anaerolineales bacterium]